MRGAQHFLCAAVIAAMAFQAEASEIVLFDGQTLNGWQGSDGGDPAGSWVVEDGALTTNPASARPVDLVSPAFPNRGWELSFSVRLSPGANSGVKYYVAAALTPWPEGTPKLKGSSAAGMELQLLAEDAPEAARPDTRSGSLYGLVSVTERVPTVAGKWIQVKISCLQFACEPWLEGKRVTAVDMTSDEFTAKLRQAATDPTRAMSAGLGAVMTLRAITAGRGRSSRFALQHHNTKVAFRDVRVRLLE